MCQWADEKRIRTQAHIAEPARRPRSEQPWREEAEVCVGLLLVEALGQTWPCIVLGTL